MTDLFASTPEPTNAQLREAAQDAVVAESLYVPSHDPDIELFVRNKRPAGRTDFGAERTLLYVHGASYPATPSFDLALDGISLMDYIALRGWDVYCVDMRGYGHSTRPPAMDAPPEDNPPLTDTQTAADDVGAVVEYIQARCGIDQLNLMGWSWGTAIMGLYTSRNGANVRRLVQYAPRWLSEGPSVLDRPGQGELGAYRTITPEAARKRWLRGVPADKVDSLIPPGGFDAWVEATWGSDPDAHRHDPPLLRAPNGVIDDDRRFWSAGKPAYAAEDIRVPTLIIHGEWDADLPTEQALGLFAALKNAPYKRLVEIGEATHALLMEKNRMHFIREVLHFLEEPGGASA